ncbi:MAG: DUF1573 domain-containing protein [Bdellovibrionota bacterium]
MVSQIMKRLCSSVIALCLFVALIVRPVSAEQKSTELPKLQVADTVFDFGTVQQGEKVEHGFTLKNLGSGTLKVERVHSSCGCTAAVIDSDTIAPGGSTDLKVTFDTSGFQGPKIKTVRIYTNDAKQPTALFTVQGNIRPDVELSVPRLNFGDIKRDDKRELRMTVSTAKSSGVKLLSVTSRSPYLELASDDVTTGDSIGKKITVKLKGPLPVGMLRDRIVVKTSSGNNPVVNIPVFARVLGDLQLKPALVSFGLLEGPLKAPLSQTVQVDNVTGAPLKITSVESDNPSVQAEAVSIQDGKAVGIKVTIREDLTGAFRARVKITTNNPDADQRQLFLPVYGIISRQTT